MREFIYDKYKIRAVDELKVPHKFDAVVIVRVDFSVPLDTHGMISDTSRIESSKKTIEHLINAGFKVLLISHFQDPKPSQSREDFSFSRIIHQIENVLGFKISLYENLEGLKSSQWDLAMIDNIRFFEGEKSNSVELAKDIIESLNADIYVNEAFSVSHRNHSSMSALPKLCKYKYAGYSLLRELEELESVLTKKNSEKIILIVGGKKASTKIPMIRQVFNDVDNIIAVGGLANAFLKAAGYDIGTSFYDSEVDSNDLVSLLDKVIIPTDLVCKTSDDEVVVCNLDSIQGSILDIGPKTIETIDSIISESNTVLWNGPAGLFEDKRFANGTLRIADSITKRGFKKIKEYLAEHPESALNHYTNLINADNNVEICDNFLQSICDIEYGFKCVIGGGDTAAAIDRKKHLVNYISTGGGAFLAFLAGESLPGIEAIKYCV